MSYVTCYNEIYTKSTCLLIWFDGWAPTPSVLTPCRIKNLDLITGFLRIILWTFIEVKRTIFILHFTTAGLGCEPENCENRNDPDLVQECLKKWWVESDFKVPNLPLSLWLKGSGCHYNSIYNNTGNQVRSTCE
jgi:hypothetical protein